MRNAVRAGIAFGPRRTGRACGALWSRIAPCAARTCGPLCASFSLRALRTYGTLGTCRTKFSALSCGTLRANGPLLTLRALRPRRTDRAGRAG